MAGTMSFANLTDTAVAMEQWSAQHGAFIDETFFKNGETLLLKRSEHFSIARHWKVCFRNTMQLSAENFRTSSSELKSAYISITIEH
jgi:hypothetical protein